MKKSISYLYVALAGFIFGGMIFFGKLFEMDGISFSELAVIPSILTTIGIFLFLGRKVFDISKLGKRWIVIYIIGGILISVGQYTPLFMGVSVGFTLLLMYAQPIWTLLISKFILKRKITKYEYLVFFFIVIGIYVLLGTSKLEGEMLGIILALMGGVGLSIEVFSVEKLSQNKVDGNTTYFWYFGITGLIFLIISLFFQNTDSQIFGLELFNFQRIDIWFYMIIFAFIFYWLGNRFLFKGFKKVPALHGGLILLLEPVVGVVLDTLFLNTPITKNEIIGGGLILIGNIILIYKEGKTEKLRV